MTTPANKNKVKVRKNKIKDNKHYRKYIERHPQNMQFLTAVYCKGCGTQIKGLNKDNTLIPFWNYREMTIEFDNGTAHTTPTCVKCDGTKSEEDLEAIYIADLEEFDFEDDDSSDIIWDRYLERIPTKKQKKKVKEAK